MLGLGAVVLLALRVWRLDADPPPLLQGDFLSDEGWWAHNARNHAIFGRWILDEHNPPLFGAPLWTASLRVVYGVLGVGIAQTRLLSALAGVATCFATYSIVRRSAGATAAALAALLVGLDPFSLVHQRSAFVEPFMTAFVAAGFAVLAWSAGRPTRAALAGAILALAVLAKLSAVGAFAVVLLWWAARAWLARTDPTVEVPMLREVIGLAAGAGAVTLGVLVAISAWDPAAAVDGVLVHRHRASISNPLRTLAIFGVRIDSTGVEAPRVGGFIRGSWPLVAGLGLAVSLALARRRRCPRDLGALLLWAWLAAAAAQIAAQEYQPDRRFLVLAPPIAGIVAIAWASGGFTPATRAELEAAGRWYRLAALSVAAACAAFLLRGIALSRLAWADPRALAESPWTAALVCGGVGLALFAIAAPVLAAAARGLARRTPPAWALAAPLAAAFLFASAATIRDVAASGASVRDVSRALATATQHWPEERRRVVGDAADTLALETRLFAFVIRRWDWVSMSMNDDGWSRFQPWISIGGEPEVGGFEKLPDLELCLDAEGRPRFRLPLYVHKDGAADVRTALKGWRAPATLRRTRAE